MSTGLAASAERLVRAMAARGLWLGVAESLTGGLLSGRIVDVPGASAVFQGAVVTYATERKQDLLGVDAGLLQRHGPVHPEVASQMAENARAALRADVTLATTGVAGPAPQDGQPVGTIYLACAHPGGVWVRHYRLGGTRRLLRAGVVDLALALGIAAVQALPAEPRRTGRVP
ncbi:MAG TPA: CinA family protein [Beutenbergiaceae bacterium]|nr:CinA family protein [Beutenbergiaceae bacterium]